MTLYSPHPRLLFKPAAALPRHDGRHPRVREAGAAVDLAAREFARSPRFPFDPHNGHNAHLIRARRMQTRVVTLLAAWVRSDEPIFRKAVLDHVAEMDAWDCWSWIAWRQGLTGPDALFDLSYGENSATLALAYDLLAPTLSDAERASFRDLAARRALSSFRIHTDPAKPAWWMNRPDSNWQTVCAGGGGMLALAMAGELPDMETLIARSDDACLRYMQKVDEYGGGCVEGLAYWNYGMRYAWLYLLSHEAATGRPHPALELAGARQTLRFPLEFNPSGVPCGFGDINHPWHPLPFHLAAADRYKDRHLAGALAGLLPEQKPEVASQGWPLAAELCFLMPAKVASGPVRKAAPKPHRHLYPKMDWGVLASAPERPRLAATIRGGSTEGSHNHLDLFSFHLALDGEAMITSVSNRAYMDSTFSDRRYDLWEVRPDAKNTLFIGGAGLSKPASVITTPLDIRGFHGFRLQGDDAIRLKLYNKPLVKSVDRLFLIRDDAFFIVIDRVALAAPNQIEARFHTLAQTVLGPAGAILSGRKAALRLTCAASAPLVVRAGMGTPTDPHAPLTNMVRVLSEKLTNFLILASVFSPGRSPVKAELAGNKRGSWTLRISGRGIRHTLPLPFNRETRS